MGRKPRVDRSPEENGRLCRRVSRAGTSRRRCRRHGIAPNLFYRWKDEAEQGAKAGAWGEKCGRRGN